MTESRELTPDSLREIADWFDTYDRLAEVYFDLLDQLGGYKPTAEARMICDSTEIQDDLRRWATEMENS